MDRQERHSYVEKIRDVFTAGMREAGRDGSDQMSCLHVARGILSMPETRPYLSGVDLVEYEHRRRMSKAHPRGYSGEVVLAPVVKEALDAKSLANSPNDGPRLYLELLGWLLAHDPGLSSMLAADGIDVRALRRAVDAPMAR